MLQRDYTLPYIPILRGHIPQPPHPAEALLGILSILVLSYPPANNNCLKNITFWRSTFFRFLITKRKFIAFNILHRCNRLRELNVIISSALRKQHPLVFGVLSKLIN